MIQNEPIYINGDGETSRDFCFIANVVQVNLLAATASVIASKARHSMHPSPLNQIYNVACGDRTTLNELFDLIKSNLLPKYHFVKDVQPVYRDFRAGDVRHSMADIKKVTSYLGYVPSENLKTGLGILVPWHINSEINK